MLKKLLLAMALMSASTIAIAQLQVTTASYDKNVLGVINATNSVVDMNINESGDLDLNGIDVQLVDSNFIIPCSSNAQVTIVAAGFDEEVDCPAFVTIEEIE
ncbi:hypothetical protein [Moritella sp. F3]|uniref:hypothetical protein n=1 Tax=Moritella sp. F3 TaxID=2718882 RepID=UPI0018E1130C|nr:hypothetical protein [Moritella sp. F3]GIC78197.1 hypothetical protein FMO001_29240 [Moritella sp. F1]GIC81159.1 hypothetical protein FMO003_14400 [Moritella sp. F3]